MADDRCKECSQPIRWATIGTFDPSVRIPLDYLPRPKGEYAILGGSTAAYVKADRRESFSGRLHTDHRRTCPGRRAVEDPDKPQLAKIRIACGACQVAKSVWGSAAEARRAVDAFLEEHTNCRGLRRKAS